MHGGAQWRMPRMPLYAATAYSRRRAVRQHTAMSLAAVGSTARHTAIGRYWQLRAVKLPLQQQVIRKLPQIQYIKCMV